MEAQKKILVLCGGRFAFPSLQILAFEKYLCGVGIGKAEPTLVDALERKMEDAGIPSKSFPHKESIQHMKAWIEKIKPDFIFSISFPFLIPEDILSLGNNIFINFHPGPLPQYRGPKPIFEVLRRQEKETAISVHYMNEGFDRGHILFKDPIQIEENDTYGTLSVKLSNRMAQVVLNTVNMLQFATIVPSKPQDESSARYFENPALSDTYIDWKRMTSAEIISLINACNPWNVGADTLLQNEPVKIIHASLINETPVQVAGGTILSVTEMGNINVACSDNKQISIEVLKTDNGIMTSKKFSSQKVLTGYCFN